MALVGRQIVHVPGGVYDCTLGQRAGARDDHALTVLGTVLLYRENVTGGMTLKITAVQAYPMAIRRSQPSWTAHEISTEATLILVEVQTDAGVCGYGEIQGGPQPLICSLVEQCGEIVRGMDALAQGDVWEKLFALTNPRPGWMRGQDKLPPP